MGGAFSLKARGSRHLAQQVSDALAYRFQLDSRPEETVANDDDRPSRARSY
jgi:hypothetical protein